MTDIARTRGDLRLAQEHIAGTVTTYQLLQADLILEHGTEVCHAYQRDHQRALDRLRAGLVEARKLERTCLQQIHAAAQRAARSPAAIPTLAAQAQQLADHLRTTKAKLEPLITTAHRDSHRPLLDAIRVVALERAGQAPPCKAVQADLPPITNDLWPTINLMERAWGDGQLRNWLDMDPDTRYALNHFGNLDHGQADPETQELRLMVRDRKLPTALDISRSPLALAALHTYDQALITGKED